jgi:PTH2 family peptidyl-tRNA hydrolase
MASYKQVIVINDDVDMSVGKKIAQACHASLNAYKKASGEQQSEWESQGSKKITLKSSDLKSLCRQAENADLPAYLVKDAGHTEVKPGTITALGIGPADEKKIDNITSQLELIK